MKKYSIDGIFGRTEFDTIDEQKDNHTTFNFMELNQNTGEYIGSEEYIKGLPFDITQDDYFKMVLIKTMKGIEKELQTMNGNKLY